MNDSVIVRRLDPEQAIDFAATTSRDRVLVTGFAGAGYGLLSPLVGPDELINPFDGIWDHEYLLLMRQFPTPSVKAALARHNLLPLAEEIASLLTCQAVLVQRQP